MRLLYDLKDKVIIITGGAGLIGKSFVKEVIKNYGVAIIVDNNKILGNKVKDDISKEMNTDKIEFIKMDICSMELIHNMINAIKKKYGRIDALVNNAYPRNKNYGRKFEDVTYEDFCENINLHVGGYFLITQQVSKVMMKQNYGNIINIGSIYGFAAPRFEIYEGTEMTMPVEYAAIKGAIINLTKYLASYLGKYNIRVNCLSPGGVYDHQPESFVKKYSQKVLLGNRMASVDDLTGTLLFLLSDDSKYLTGQNIVVDGGWSL